jgi:hypothetical protein
MQRIAEHLRNVGTGSLNMNAETKDDAIAKVARPIRAVNANRSQVPCAGRSRFDDAAGSRLVEGAKALRPLLLPDFV